jgi:hypothetical protein
LGLAALICQSKVDQMLTEVQQLVVDEVRKSGWFPQELLGFVQKVLFSSVLGHKNPRLAVKNLGT